jgi:predicted short-subunit dehydrogenase-like oxidoreductase (DUF2520 family)
MAPLPDISILGPGKVGTAIGILAARAGLRVAMVGGRDVGRAKASAGAIGPGVRAGTLDQAARAGGLVVLTVADDAIAPVCAALAKRRSVRRGTVVVHCSGALGSDVLAPLRESCSARVASMHVLQTFPTVRAAVRKVPGSYFFCEGDRQALTVVRGLVKALEGRLVVLGSKGKVVYHAAAVVASNYLTTLMDAAFDLMRSAGIARETARKALEPLVRATVDNVFSMGPAEALTGPIARGDAQTVRGHAEAIVATGDRWLPGIYRGLGGKAIDLALRKGSIDFGQAMRLLSALYDRPITRLVGVRAAQRAPRHAGRKKRKGPGT